MRWIGAADEQYKYKACNVYIGRRPEPLGPSGAPGCFVSPACHHLTPAHRVFHLHQASAYIPTSVSLDHVFTQFTGDARRSSASTDSRQDCSRTHKLLFTPGE
eukprot:scaffold12646_cov115-Isochrysis_galbana.AAC.6